MVAAEAHRPTVFGEWVKALTALCSHLFNNRGHTITCTGQAFGSNYTQDTFIGNMLQKPDVNGQAHTGECHFSGLNISTCHTPVLALFTPPHSIAFQ